MFLCCTRWAYCDDRQKAAYLARALDKVMPDWRRLRATAVVVREGRVLLVKDRGRHSFSLPGGGLKRGEPAIGAAARELYEELGLRAIKIERLRGSDFRGKSNKHKVCLVTEFDGQPQVRGRELSKFIWWDMSEHVPTFAHVESILGALDRLGKLERH